MSVRHCDSRIQYNSSHTIVHVCNIVLTILQLFAYYHAIIGNMHARAVCTRLSKVFDVMRRRCNIKAKQDMYCNPQKICEHIFTSHFQLLPVRNHS